MTTLEILRAARELISVPERWTKRQPARDRNGETVAATSPDAIAWCAVGACWRVAQTRPDEGPFTALFDAMTEGDSLGKYNDSRTHNQVLDWFDRAIAKLERPDGRNADG